MIKFSKLKKGDKVAILSPSFAAPAVWPHVYKLGLSRLKEVFGLEPVEYPTTTKLNASAEERAADLIASFEDQKIKGVISTIGGNDQASYIKNLPNDVFIKNPKPFFGYSNNSHFCNFLFTNNIPSYYGGSLFSQFSMQKEMDSYTVEYLKYALFEEGEFELRPSEKYNDIELDWGDESLLNTKRIYELSDGWHWSGDKNAEGLLWGGSINSIDEMLKNNILVPSLNQFEDIVLIIETSENIPNASDVSKVIRNLGERGFLERVQGVLMGRPKAWNFDKQKTIEEKEKYRNEQREVVLKTVRLYNKDIPIVQNMNFGHTDPQIPMPYGNKVRIITKDKKIYATF